MKKTLLLLMVLVGLGLLATPKAEAFIGISIGVPVAPVVYGPGLYYGPYVYGQPYGYWRGGYWHGHYWRGGYYNRYGYGRRRFADRHHYYRR